MNYFDSASCERRHERYRDRELRVLLDIDEGERFDESDLQSGVRTLMSLGSFRGVTTEVDVATTRGRRMFSTASSR